MALLHHEEGLERSDADSKLAAETVSNLATKVVIPNINTFIFADS